MRQVFLQKGMICVKEVVEPILAKNMILVEVHYSCISPGTEQATIAHAQQNPFFHGISQKIGKVLQSVASNGIEGTKALVKEKIQGSLQALGYSCSGKVIATGKSVSKFRAGDTVACAGAGFANHASMIVVPENLVVHLANELLLKEGSVTTLGTIALQGVRRAGVQLGETVCVLGLGLLGQLTVQLAKLSGGKIVGIDLLQDRLTLAQQHGADYIINPVTHDVKNEIASITQHYGVDVTIITAACASNELIQQAMEITRKKGRVVIVGDVGLGLQRAPFYQKEIDLLMSCSYGPGRYDVAYEQEGQDYPYAYVRWTENRNMQAFVNLLAEGKLKINNLITETFAIDDVEDAYDTLKHKQLLGALIDYTAYHAEKDAQQKNEQPMVQLAKKSQFIPAVKDVLRVGVVGVGGFAKVKLMPIIARLKQVKINAIVDANIANSLTVSRLYNASKALTDDRDLFNEDLVDAVIIASPHTYHCDQALAALEHGKAVFLEKPMATSFEQLQKISRFLDSNPEASLCVDYNRSFAPFIEKIKEVIAKRNSPLFITYRMNVGFIARDHWVQTEIGAGRIIGEVCHIIDLFFTLTNSQPISVSVESIKSSRDDVFPTDNLSVQISFADGSLCNLVYTALGHADLGKERMEIFFDSKAIVMDDYKTLQGFGLPSSFDETTNSPDKGHEMLLQTFFNRLRGEQFSPPISYERLHQVANLTLIIDQLACQAGGTKDFIVHK